MGADLVPFDFDSHRVRTIIRDGNPWFVAVDVCRVLGLENHRQVVSALDDDERDGVQISDAIGRTQTTTVISASGFYFIVGSSDKPVAKRFSKWVRSEVLPAIRRDGFYGIAGADRSRLEARRGYFQSVPDKTKDRILRLLTDAEAVPMRMAIQQALIRMAFEQALIDPPHEAPLPEASTGLIAAYRRAYLARSGMDSAATGQMRDEATADYARACDPMVTLMSFLANDGDLGLISDRLSRGVAA